MKDIDKKQKKEIKMQFIRTTDSDTAQKLRESGYTELTESSSRGFCFLNNGKLMFCDDEKNEEINKNIVYSNILCI